MDRIEYAEPMDRIEPSERNDRMDRRERLLRIQRSGLIELSIVAMKVVYHNRRPMMRHHPCINPGKCTGVVRMYELSSDAEESERRQE